jgi:NAD(P)-dependent dehydrogenase (short-subunit alcohol dehydrogenase family)
VINLSSNSGRMGGFENGMAYSASKGGIIAMTYGMARQLAPRRITVNCIAPGTIEPICRGRGILRLWIVCYVAFPLADWAQRTRWPQPRATLPAKRQDSPLAPFSM